MGVLTGPLYDAGYFHVLLGVGPFLIVFGQMMLSICHEYYQVLLAQGICMGLGAGCIFIPGIAILSTYFNTKLALANEIAAAGSGMGKWIAFDCPLVLIVHRRDYLSNCLSSAPWSNWLWMDRSRDRPDCSSYTKPALII